jgi:hypothetical protein
MMLRGVLRQRKSNKKLEAVLNEETPNARANEGAVDLLMQEIFD